MLSKKEIEHIARLARLHFTDKELEKFSDDLNEILSFFKKLEKVKTGSVPETSQVTGLENIARPDEVFLCDREDDLLECAPHEIEKHSIKIPKIM